MKNLKYMAWIIIILFAILIFLVPFFPGLCQAGEITCYQDTHIILHAYAKEFNQDSNTIWFTESKTGNQIFVQNMDCIVKLKH